MAHIEVKVYEIPIDEADVEYENAKAIHEMSMSLDPLSAAGGRFLKELHPIMERFLKSERARGTAPSVFFSALVKASLTELASIVLEYASTSSAIQKNLEVLRTQMDFEMNHMIGIVRKLDEEEKRRS